MSQSNIFCDLRSARTRASSNSLEGVCETDTGNVVMGEPVLISSMNPILTPVSRNPILRPDSRQASVEALDSPLTKRARLHQADKELLKMKCGGQKVTDWTKHQKTQVQNPEEPGFGVGS